MKGSANGPDSVSSTNNNVVVYTWMDPDNPKAGGDVKYLHEICRRLVRDGFEVQWIASRFPGSAAAATRDGIKITRIGSIYSVFIAHHFAYRAKEANQEGAAIETVSSIPFFRFKQRAREIILIHHLVPFSQMWQKVGPLAPLAFAFERVVAPAVYRDRSILVPSRSSQQEVKRLGYRNVRLFKSGVDAVEVNLREKEPIVVAPGPVKPWKHHDDIIRAFSECEAPWKLAIFGGYETPELERNLIRIVKEHSLNDRVMLLGRISDVAKENLMRRSSICAIASEKEGWGLVAMEAQAVGCPVIAYDVQGINEAVVNGETGILVEARNQHSLANAMKLVMKNEPMRMKMANDAISRSRSYDWESCYRVFRSMSGNPVLPIPPPTP